MEAEWDVCQDDLAGCPPLDLTPLLIADWPSDRKTIEDVLDVSLVRSHPAFLSYATSTDEIGFTGSFYYASHDYPHAFNGDWIWGLLRLVMVGYNDSSVRFWVLVTSDPAGRTGHTEELYSQVTRSASKVYSRPDSFVQGQHGDLSYCYSYLRGDYADVPLGCLLPGNSYERFLVVRKRNVIIKISEYTWTAKTLRMQEAIDALGAALRRD